MLFGVAQAADTLITYIAGYQTATNPWSSNTRIMTLADTDMSFVNKWNNADSIWDYFNGYYYDPAYGVFQMNASLNPAQNVQVSWVSYSWCSTGYAWYRLSWYSYNTNFGFVDFASSAIPASNRSYICIPIDGNDDTLTAYMWWYAYSSYLGFQNFDGIRLDTSVDLWVEHNSEGRFIKVEGLVSSQNTGELIADQFRDDVRVVGNITKSSLRKQIQQKVFSVIKNVSPNNGSNSVSGLGASLWSGTNGKILQNGKVLYFWDVWGANIIISGNDNIGGSKTLVVEGGNIYITGNIRGTGMLGLVALQKNNQGGNIYIDPSVTDIHAIMYADRALMSYDGSSELDGNTQAQDLASQLYIYGSIFSENTIGGSSSTLCPFYESSCNDAKSKKYDLNYLRRYILVQEVDVDGNPIWPKEL